MSGFGGIQIISNPDAYELVEDWSNCRSRSRAERRRKQAHRQNVVMVRQPVAYMMSNRMVVHPETVAKLVLATSTRDAANE